MTLPKIALSPRTALRARYVFPVVGEPIADGVVAIENGRIAFVGNAHGASNAVEDLGDVAILPGLVNAHVHLNFSQLPAPLGHPGISLVEWIRGVMQWREKTAAEVSSLAPIVSRGVQESLQAGVTTLAEIARPNWPVDVTSDLPINVALFQELIAPSEQRVASAIELAEVFLQSVLQQSTAHQLLPGLSPHAPYSVHPRLLAEIVRIASRWQAPVAMHLAESREEMEFLQAGTGPFRTFLEDIGAWDKTLFTPGSQPLDYLRQLARAPRTLVIHGNYLSDEEIRFLAVNAARMSVVYCPRTHAWFDHDRYPLQKMLTAGMTLALGTDGRGSSPDLNLLEEMRFAAAMHPEVPRSQILQMATLGGARALGLGQEIGSLQPGKAADLIVVPVPEHSATDPHNLLFESQQLPVRRYFRGNHAVP